MSQAAMPEAQAPGCFGAASVFSMDSKVCQACPAFNVCGDASIKTLEQIRDTVNVRDLLARHAAARLRAQQGKPANVAPQPIAVSPIPVAQRAPIAKPVERKTAVERVTFSISDDDQHVIAILGEQSSKTKEQAIVLCKQNKINDCRSMLPKGVNPFAKSGPSYLRVACDMLISGPVTKASLRLRLVKELSWTDNTAGSHVAIACALLYAFQITIPDGEGAFILNPALGRDNKT